MPIGTPVCCCVLQTVLILEPSEVRLEIVRTWATDNVSCYAVRLSGLEEKGGGRESVPTSIGSCYALLIVVQLYIKVYDTYVRHYHKKCVTRDEDGRTSLRWAWRKKPAGGKTAVRFFVPSDNG